MLEGLKRRKVDEVMTRHCLYTPEMDLEDLESGLGEGEEEKAAG